MRKTFSGSVSHCEELRQLVKLAKQPTTEETPVEIRINLRNLPPDLGEIGTHRCVEYEIVNHNGDVLIGGQGWSLEDAFREARTDFFDIIDDT